MGVGVRIAIIAILLIVVGTFLLVAMHVPEAQGGGGGPTPTPDPNLGSYIEAVRWASTSLSGMTNKLLALTSKLPSNLDASFALYDHKVDSSGATATRKDIDDTIIVLSRKIDAYAGIVNKFDKMVQAWTVCTAQYEILSAKPDAGALPSQILDPMAVFLTVSGLLSTFVSAWKSAYAIASVPVNSNMSHVLDEISDGANIYSTQGALGNSPYESSAKMVSSTYMALFDNIVGV